MMEDILSLAESKRLRALRLLERLELFDLWRKHGEPVLVGAVRYGMVGALDIDMEVYSERPEMRHGFEVMAQAAVRPEVQEVHFVNALETPDRGLYWSLKVRDAEGESWKIDCWHVAHDHPDAHWAERFADAVTRVLTDETRRAILALKAELRGTEGVRGVDLCRAVLGAGVRDSAQFRRWFAANPPGPGMLYWLPGTHHSRWS
ncbi:hypothetical protein LLH00_13485 [bacterium]|nr:hypothetical protein [bacterium]